LFRYRFYDFDFVIYYSGNGPRSVLVETMTQHVAPARAKMGS